MKVSLRHNWFSSQKVEFVHKFVTACGKQELFLSQEALLVRSNECVWSSQALHFVCATSWVQFIDRVLNKRGGVNWLDSRQTSQQDVEKSIRIWWRISSLPLPQLGSP